MNRRGSALLIVLGFLSFMVVSAVAFSVWMRSERVPSAAFRRETAVRHLVKAGLARAMSEIDDAIRADPNPGVSASGTIYQNGAGLRWNNWEGRLFMPPDPDDWNCQYYLAPRDQTVSVVNLEGIGYLPPFLMNDVRLRGQSSWTAKWRYLDHGAGRCAYLAVDVSDLLDMNKLVNREDPENAGRTSSQPLTLVNLYLDDNGKVDTARMKKFADFIANAEDNGSYGNTVQNGCPYVSLMDYNLAAISGKVDPNDESPFLRWIDQNGNGKTFYQGYDLDEVRQQLFTTDSYLPPAPQDEGTKPSLAVLSGSRTERGQPFDDQVFNHLTGKNNIDHILDALDELPDTAQSEETKKTGVNFKDLLTIPDMVNLCDYLDRDDIPTSLALPTLERNPMIVALQPSVGINFTVPAVKLQEATAANPGPVSTVVNLEKTSYQPLSTVFQVTLNYPFKRDFASANLDNASYTLEAVAKVFFVDRAALPGTRGKDMGPRFDQSAFRPTDAEWAGNSSYNDRVLTFVANPKSLGGSRQFLENVQLSFKPINDDIPLAEYVSTWVPGNPQLGTPGHAEGQWIMRFFPTTSEGGAVDGFNSTAPATALPAGKDFVPVMAVWIRLKDSRNFVADMVPATFYDDKFNSLQANADVPNAKFACGQKEPLLRFTSSASAGFDYKAVQDSITAGTPYNVDMSDWQQKSLFAVDPRYNYAPEDWCSSSSGVDAGSWEAQIGMALDNGDGDPYLFVSNQGFLQSMGEFAFLPMMHASFRETRGNANEWGFFCKQDGNGDRNIASFSAIERYNGLSDYASVGDARFTIMWHTYDVVGDALFSCGIAERAGGLRVSPYSGPETIRQALYNTPVDWWAAAGTNTSHDASSGQNSGDTIGSRKKYFGTVDQSLKFAFNREGSAASEQRELQYDWVRNLAQGMSKAFRESDITQLPSDGPLARETWQRIYDSWDWTPNGTPFSWAGTQFCNQLDLVDCKYLYGFWRNCFATRQQLFIVFVRAESMTLGGSGEGGIPPQQGGRAVAVVWRDPQKFANANETVAGTPETRDPHRMRVLFYHQFE